MPMWTLQTVVFSAWLIEIFFIAVLRLFTIGELYYSLVAKLIHPSVTCQITLLHRSRKRLNTFVFAYITIYKWFIQLISNLVWVRLYTEWIYFLRCFIFYFCLSESRDACFDRFFFSYCWSVTCRTLTAICWTFRTSLHTANIYFY